MNAVVFGLILAAIVASTAAESGSISVENNGGFVTKLFVSYTVDGERKTGNSGVFSYGETKSIQIPEDATNVFFRVTGNTGPGQTQTIFSRDYSGPVSKCFRIRGTSLSPEHSEIDC